MPDNLPAVRELPPEHVQVYLEAMTTEFNSGRAYLLSIWDCGHALRRYNDPVELITRAIGRSPAWVYDRIKLSRDFERRELIAMIDRNDLTSKSALFRLAYGRGTTSVTRRGLYIPQRLITQAEVSQVDLMGEIREFFATVTLPELRAILRRFGAERDDTHRL